MTSKQIPFYGAEHPRLFEIERRCMDRDGIVLKHLDRILPSGCVLDIGAGNGFTAALMTQKGRWVIPIEPSLPMIDKKKPLPWMVGVAQELPFENDSFSAAYATWAYFFSAYGFIENGLKEAYRVVKSQGKIIIVDNAGKDEFCGLFKRDISSDPSWWHRKGFDCQILNSAFKFDSEAEAEALLSYYWQVNGRKWNAKVRTEIEYKVAVYTTVA